MIDPDRYRIGDAGLFTGGISKRCGDYLPRVCHITIVGFFFDEFEAVMKESGESIGCLV